MSKRRPHLKTRKNLERTKLWSWLAPEPETKIDCAGEAQQQITRPTDFLSTYTDCPAWYSGRTDFDPRTRDLLSLLKLLLFSSFFPSNCQESVTGYVTTASLQVPSNTTIYNQEVVSHSTLQNHCNYQGFLE
jgi:hypothetical protein